MWIIIGQKLWFVSLCYIGWIRSLCDRMSLLHWLDRIGLDFLDELVFLFSFLRPTAWKTYAAGSAKSYE